MLIGRVRKLLDFVKLKHEGQYRKYTNHPYWFHLVSVSRNLVRNEVENLSVEIALCHDLFEDTDCSIWELNNFLEQIGYEADEIVIILNSTIWLTDFFTKESFPNKNRKERKELEAERLGKAPSIVQTVKYADMIDNSRSIIDRDDKFAKIYIAEKRMYIDAMTEGNEKLRNEALQIIKDYEQSSN